jgi:hypothetical protein
MTGVTCVDYRLINDLSHGEDTQFTKKSGPVVPWAPVSIATSNMVVEATRDGAGADCCADNTEMMTRNLGEERVPVQQGTARRAHRVRKLLTENWYVGQTIHLEIHAPTSSVRTGANCICHSGPEAQVRGGAVSSVIRILFSAHVPFGTNHCR